MDTYRESHVAATAEGEGALRLLGGDDAAGHVHGVGRAEDAGRLLQLGVGPEVLVLELVDGVAGEESLVRERRLQRLAAVILLQGIRHGRGASALVAGRRRSAGGRRRSSGGLDGSTAQG